MAWREKSLHAPFHKQIQRLPSVDRCVSHRRKNYPLTRLSYSQHSSFSHSFQGLLSPLPEKPIAPLHLSSLLVLSGTELGGREGRRRRSSRKKGGNPNGTGRKRRRRKKKKKKGRNPTKNSMAARPSGNRRALGDIGNIVGALSATYLVTKPQHQPQLQQQKNFGTELTLKNQVNGQGEDGSKNGRKASSSTKKRNRIPDIDGHERMPVDGMGEEEEGQEKENARKKKLERRECASAIDAPVSTETAEPCPDGKVNLHV